MIIRFLRKLKRTNQFLSLCRRLSEPVDYVNPSAHADRNKKAIDELIEFSLSDPINVELLLKNGFDPNTLRDIYAILIRTAGVKVRDGLFVPAATIVKPFSLIYALNNFDGSNFKIESFDSYQSALVVSEKLTNYFKTNNSKILWDPDRLGDEVRKA